MLFLNNFETFFKEFIMTFGDYDGNCTSTNKLRSLHQGSWFAFVYAYEFEQLTYDISWDEAAFMNQFQFGLCSDMKDILMTMLDPTTFSKQLCKLFVVTTIFFNIVRKNIGTW
jgi:hypothetical protein